MESKSRRVYTRFDQTVVCFKGAIFGLQSSRTNVVAGSTAFIAPAERSHGKARVTVTQGNVKETWVERKL